MTADCLQELVAEFDEAEQLWLHNSSITEAAILTQKPKLRFAKIFALGLCLPEEAYLQNLKGQTADVDLRVAVWVSSTALLELQAALPAMRRLWTSPRKNSTSAPFEPPPPPPG